MTITGSIAIALSEPDLGDGAASAAAASELEDLGFDTVWLPGGQGNNLPGIERAVRATRAITVASGIIPVNQVTAGQVAATYADLQATHPGRFVVGLGGAHGPQPLPTLTRYLDVLDTVEPVVPASVRILAALGPRMLDLARDRAAGAYPFLVTPDYVAEARTVLGPDRTLAVLLLTVPEADPTTARERIRGRIRFYTGVPGYYRNFLRMGLTVDDITELSDRLIDAVTAWGDLEAIVARVDEYRAAGADQVVLALGDPGNGEPVAAWWQRLAQTLLR